MWCTVSPNRKQPQETSITSIRNLGPATAELFSKHGLHTAEEVIELGADAAYAHLLRSGMRPHFIGYYALVLGLQGRPWSDCGKDEKRELRRKFDEIKACCFDTNQSALEQLLDEIGVLRK